MNRNNHGYTITEVLVATIVVIIVAYAISASVPSFKNQETASRSVTSCREYLDEAFANFEQYGVQGNLTQNPFGASNYPSPGTFPVPTLSATAPVGIPIFGLTASDLYPISTIASPGNQIVNWANSSTPTYLQNASVYGGSVTMINALFNKYSTAGSTTDICSPTTNWTSATFSYLALNNTTTPKLKTFTGIPATAPTPQILPSPPPDLNADGKFEVRLSITPYNLRTNTLVPNCSTAGFTQTSTIIPTPLGLSTTSTEAQTGKGPGGTALKTLDGTNTSTIAELSANVVNNRGFLVTIGANFDIPNNTGSTVQKSCYETRLIAYPSITTLPSTPSFYSSITDPGGATKWGPDSFVFGVVNNTTSGKPGNVLMCRDRSAPFTPFNTNGKTNGNVNPALIPAPSTYNWWLPCDKMTLCGKGRELAIDNVSGFNGTICTGTTGTAATYCIEKTFSSSTYRLPYGCEIIVDAVSVDPAGNVSPVATFDQKLMDPYVTTGCAASVINNCTLPATTTIGATIGGTCSGSGGSGACSYKCTAGGWTAVSACTFTCINGSDDLNCCNGTASCTPGSQGGAVDTCGCETGHDYNWNCPAGTTVKFMSHYPCI